MPPTGALLLALTLATPPDRLLLCRPVVRGDPALAQAGAVAQAARGLELVLDYGVPCESLGEAARAARRAGLEHALWTSADGRADGTAFELVLASTDEEVLGRRSVAVTHGADAATPVRQAILDLADGLPRPPPERTRVVAWSLVGAGAVALVAGAVLAAQARSDAGRADHATTPEDWTAAHQAWRQRRAQSGVALAIGGAAVAAGLTLRVAY